MRLPKRGEKGFTLIELLIVVAILGVLAAVVIPNVGRFLGRGEEESRRVEYNTVRSAVTALMVDNGLTEIPNPIKYVTGGATTNAVNDLTAFPDVDSDNTTDGNNDDIKDKVKDPDREAYTFGATGDKPGYLLYTHDMTADIKGVPADTNPGPTVNYVSTTPTVYYYTCDFDGTIRQWETADTTDANGHEYTY